jgi:tetratricopeptide (TPR) repeat protein
MTTSRSVLPLALAAAAALCLPSAGSADGGSSLPPPAARQPLTPEQEAVELYNDGNSYRDKAASYEKEAAAESDAKKKEKLEKKALDKHESSIKKFDSATQKNPRMFQAWGNLGYAYRKTGKYAEALQAYDKALELEQGYTPAIEYRAEAYLGLDRLDDVKNAYMTLFRVDRVRADELAAAIDRYLQKKKAEPGGVDPAALESFASWAAERKQLASQTSSLLLPQPPRW